MKSGVFSDANYSRHFALCCETHGLKRTTDFTDASKHDAVFDIDLRILFVLAQLKIPARDWSKSRHMTLTYALLPGRAGNSSRGQQ